MFGVSSDTSEAAKALLYPHPSDADMKVTTEVAGLITLPGGFYELSQREARKRRLCMISACPSHADSPSLMRVD